MQNVIRSWLVEAIFTITLKTKSLEKSGSLILPYSHSPACIEEEGTAKGGNEGCGAKLIKVVLVARFEEGIPELAVRLTLDMGTMVGTLVISSGPSNSGPWREKTKRVGF